MPFLNTPGNKYMLLVDDDPITLKVLQHHVSTFLHSNIEVLSFRHGEQAIEQAKEIVENGGHILVAIVDYYMSPMMGSEVLIQLDKIVPSCKKIMLTGQADLRAVTGVIENIPLFRYITKPWQHHDLEMTLKEAVRMYSYEMEILERNAELEKIKESLEETVKERTEQLIRKNSELEEGLKYARHIQECFLPDTDEARKLLPHLTIFNSPANGISGDFIWYKEIQNKVVVALGDSTGHGLAGALITVMATDILSSKAVKGFHDCTLSEFLTSSILELRGRLTKELSSRNNFIGVDLVIVSVDINTGEMEWASMNGNLLLIDEKNEVTVLNKAKGFVNLPNYQEKIASGTVNIRNKRVAMMSDGVYDQLHYATQKRMRFSGLIDSIERGHVFNDEFCAIETCFNQWKGGAEQTDDALWISFSL